MKTKWWYDDMIWLIVHRWSSVCKPLLLTWRRTAWSVDHVQPLATHPTQRTGVIMIDLSFLTKEEQDIILAVLKRDAELKKAEEQRVQWVPHVGRLAFAVLVYTVCPETLTRTVKRFKQVQQRFIYVYTHTHTVYCVKCCVHHIRPILSLSRSQFMFLMFDKFASINELEAQASQ